MTHSTQPASESAASASTTAPCTSGASGRARHGVLLVTTGSPAAPTAEAVRDYLGAFLSDKRICDMPSWQWMPVLHGIILPRRSPKSAELYKEIWMGEGSPLTVYTERQRAGIEAGLRAAGRDDVPVVSAFRYGEPSIEAGLTRLLDQRGIDRLIVLPVYPQYASVTNGTMAQEVLRLLSTRKRIPGIDFIDSFCNDPAYLDALAANVAAHWSYVDDGRHRLVFTYHSTLVADTQAGDVYRDQAEATARQVAARLGIPEAGWCVGYQSVFDKRPWLGPLTATDILPQLAEQGVTNVAVCAPGFTCECLETHNDIDVEQRGIFERLVPQGSFTYVPCLNDAPDFLQALTNLVLRHIIDPA